MRPAEGCAACGSATQKKFVSPYEEVSATFCEECRHVVAAVSELVDAAGVMAQTALQMNTLRRLRRVEQVTETLIRRRMVSARLAKGTWDDLADALGMTAEQAKQRYPLRDTDDDNWGWG